MRRIFSLPIHRFLTPLLVLLIFAIVVSILTFSHQCDRLDCLTFSDKSRYKLQDIYEASENQFRALYRHDDLLLRVVVHSKINESEAKTLIDGQIAQIKTQYADARAPYPGEITKTIACEKHYQPSFRQESVSGLSMTIVESYLTDRLTYGACTNEQATFRSVLSLFYCPMTHQLYQLEFIAPYGNQEAVSQYNALLSTIRCGKKL